MASQPLAFAGPQRLMLRGVTGELHAYLGGGNKVIHQYGTFFFVNGSDYTKDNNARKWTIHKSVSRNVNITETFTD